MARKLIALALAASALAAAAPAAAQLSVTFYSREDATSERDELSDGFNLEECQNDSFMTFRLSYSGSLGAGDLYIYVGSACNEKENRDEGRCFAAVENRPLESLSNYEIHPAWVVDPLSETPSCVEGEGASDVWFLVLANDSNQSVVYEQLVTINYDTEPPQPPVDIRAGYGEGMITVRWDVAEPDFPEEWAHFYVMCWAEGMTAPEAAEPSPEPAPEPTPDASTDVADDTLDEDLDAWDVDETPAADPGPEPSPDPAVDTGTGDTATTEGCPPGGFNQGDAFDEAYACSDRLGSSTRSFDLHGLENDQPYKVSVVAIDEYGNESEIGEVVCETPQAVDDFWEVYKKAGGGDEGGFCFVATAAYGDYDHPAVVALRAFRDEVLVALPGGPDIVGTYYRLSPPLARWLDDRPGPRSVARLALWPVAGAARAAVAGRRNPAAVLAVVLGLALGLVGALGGRRR